MRSASRRALFAVAVSLFVLASCSDVLHQSTQPARLDLSLTGPVPERIGAFELEVSAPGMETITEQLGPRGSGTTTLELPGGRNRRFSIFSINEDGDYDVYAGEMVASVAPGRQTRVRVPVTPGPVIVDNQNNRFVQISDIENRAQRSISGDDLGEITLQPSDAVYDDSGRLWVVSDIQTSAAIVAFSSIGGGLVESDIETNVVYQNSALSVDSSTERLYVYGSDTENYGIWTFDFDGQLLTSGLPINGFLENPWFRSVSGLSVDPTGEYLFIVAATFDERTPVVLKLNIETEEVVRSVQFESPFPGSGDPRWFGDVMVMANRVFVADPIDKQVLVYDLDLNHLRTYGSAPRDENRPEPGEFWGPRRFVATRPDDQIIVIDQQFDTNLDDSLDGRGRIVSFRLDQPEQWRVLEDDSFVFFNTNVFFC